MDELLEEVSPFLDKARAAGCVPRRDVVPQMRSSGVSVVAIKLFKRVLKQEGISLDGGALALKGEGRPSPSE